MNIYSGLNPRQGGDRMGMTLMGCLESVMHHVTPFAVVRATFSHPNSKICSDHNLLTVLVTWGDLAEKDS